VVLFPFSHRRREGRRINAGKKLRTQSRAVFFILLHKIYESRARSQCGFGTVKDARPWPPQDTGNDKFFAQYPEIAGKVIPRPLGSVL
jgi:hypothetical protein